MNIQELDTTPWEPLVRPSLLSRTINLTTIRGLDLERCQNGRQVRKYHGVRRIATINGTPRQARFTGRLAQLTSMRRGHHIFGEGLDLEKRYSSNKQIVSAKKESQAVKPLEVEIYARLKAVYALSSRRRVRNGSY